MLIESDETTVILTTQTVRGIDEAALWALGHWLAPRRRSYKRTNK